VEIKQEIREMELESWKILEMLLKGIWNSGIES
jgi:hypothetical protein